jgi:aminoglycoside phosphotransferase (APT) family kinase protein
VDHALVLRTNAPSELPFSLSRAEEYTVLNTVFAAGVRVPEPLWVCKDPAVIGREFYLMRRLEGTAAGHRLVRDTALDEHTRERLVEDLGRELGKLHAVTPPSVALTFLPVPENAANTRIRLYRAALDEIREPYPGIEYGLRWLERHAPPSPRITLCHSDYRTGNYLIKNGRLTGILDWEFAAWSEPMEDVGWFCARCWRFGRWAQEAGGIGSRQAFYRGYEQQSGNRIVAGDVAYWEIMAAVRWAVIACQQYDRHSSGMQSSLELALTGWIVPELEAEILHHINVVEGLTKP